jgi:molecular chaperone GrpE (heat shock protein)
MKILKGEAPQETSPEERQKLEKLKKKIDRATADGKISHDEIENIKKTMNADRKVTVAELALYKHHISFGKKSIEEN